MNAVRRLSKVAAEQSAAQPSTTEPRPAGDLRVIRISATTIAVILIAFALRFAGRLLIPITCGLLVSYALEPPVAVLERHRVPRWLAALVVLSLVTSGLGLAAYGLWN